MASRYAYDLNAGVPEAHELQRAIKTRHRDEHDPSVECTDLACLLSLYVYGLEIEAQAARGRRLLARRRILSHATRLHGEHPRAWRHRREREVRDRERRGWEYGCSVITTGGKCEIWPRAVGCDVCGARLSKNWREGRVVGRIGDRDINVILCSDACARSASKPPRPRTPNAATSTARGLELFGDDADMVPAWDGK